MLVAAVSGITINLSYRLTLCRYEAEVEAPTQTTQKLSCGIASRFASRNNDIDGDWALGLLYAAADKAAIDTIRLNLVSEAATPPFKGSGRVLSRFGVAISEWTKRAYESRQSVRSADSCGRDSCHEGAKVY